MTKPSIVALLCALFTVPVSHAQSYLVGGIGLDERQQLEAREKDYNLKLVFTLNERNYLSDVDVVINDVRGASVLNLTTTGPLLLTNLPTGAYTVRATHAGETRIRKVALNGSQKVMILRWPSNPETDFPGPKWREERISRRGVMP